MIKLIYIIDLEHKDAELDWLREQKVYPSFEETYEWTSGKSMLRVGVIVNEEAALSIKLRHNAQQIEYRQR